MDEDWVTLLKIATLGAVIALIILITVAPLMLLEHWLQGGCR